MSSKKCFIIQRGKGPEREVLSRQARTICQMHPSLPAFSDRTQRDDCLDLVDSLDGHMAPMPHAAASQQPSLFFQIRTIWFRMRPQ